MGRLAGIGTQGRQRFALDCEASIAMRNWTVTGSIAGVTVGRHKRNFQASSGARFVGKSRGDGFSETLRDPYGDFAELLPHPWKSPLKEMGARTDFER